MRETFSPAFLGLILGADHAAQEILRRDAESCREAFAADGIDAATVLAGRRGGIRLTWFSVHALVTFQPACRAEKPLAQSYFEGVMTLAPEPRTPAHE